MKADVAAGTTSTDWGTRAVMLCGGLLSALAMVAIISVLPKVETALGQGPNDSMLVKQLVGIVSLAMVLGSPLAGFMVDRFGLRRVLVTAALVYAFAGTAGLYLNGLPALVVSRFFVGLAAATIQIISFTLINTRLEKHERPKWMGAHVSIAMIGTIIVHPVAGLMGEASWRLPFALYAVGLLLVPVALLDRSEHRRALPSRVPTEKQQARDRFWNWFPFRYALLAFCIGSIAYLPMVYVPFLLRQQGIASSSLISLVLTADSIVGASMAMLYGRARKSYSANAAFAFSFATTGVGTLIAALAPGVAGTVAGLLVFGFGVGWLVPNLMTAVGAKVTQTQQGRAAGFVKAAHFMAAPVCIALMEPVARKFGPQSAMLVVSTVALSLFGVMVYSIFTTRKPENVVASATP